MGEGFVVVGDIGDYREHADRLLLAYRTAKAAYSGERLERRRLRNRIDTLEQAQKLAQEVAAAVQTQAHARIAAIVTKCLAIFDEPYEFHIEFRRLRGKTEAHLQFLRDGKVVDPLTASGGGVVDVAAFALRVACLCLRRPQLRKLLVLDEPFKNVSSGYVPQVRRLVESLSKDLHVQFLIVTHDEALSTGKVVDLAD
jgi:energy-coupling factor transporter ATP-binding protein EcfA2